MLKSDRCARDDRTRARATTTTRARDRSRESMGTGRNRAPVASSASTATSSSRDAVISRRDHHLQSDDALDAFLQFAARAKTTLASADGKDKVLSFCQYACMFVGGGVDGRATRAQKSLAASRKPFRLWKPVEAAMPLLEARKRRKSLGVTSADRAAHVLRALGMCAYFGFDHVVWATQAGVVADESKTLGEYAQKVSYWGWFVGSASGLFLNTAELNALLDAMREKGFARPEGVDAEVDADAEETNEEERERRDAEREEIRQRARKVFVGLITNSAQTVLAMALLGRVKMSKRKIGALGMFLSAVHVASILPPAIPPAKEKTV